MTVSSKIVGGKTARTANVTSRGQLVVSPLAFSEPFTASINAINTAFSLVPAKKDSNFVITDIIFDADRNVSANTPATVVLYESSTDTSLTVDRLLLSLEMLKNTNRFIGSLNLLVSKGKWLNIKTDDATVNATILGYYVESE